MVERNSKGQFKKGSSGNPNGRPTRKDSHYYQLLLETIQPEDFIETVQKCAELAKRGNQYARKDLWNYILGNPQNYLDISQGGVWNITVEYKEADQDPDHDGTSSDD